MKHLTRIASILIGLSILLSACAAPAETVAAEEPLPAEVESEVTATEVPVPTAEPEVQPGVVTTTENEGTGSLREVVSEAQPGDIITFDPSVFPPENPAIIHLSMPGPIFLNQGDITIDASSAGVILDGEGGPETGLSIKSKNNVVYGIKFINFALSGILMDGENNPEMVTNNIVGGDRDMGEGPYGQGNCFGQNEAAIYIQRGASGNMFTGNLVGTDYDGSDIGNKKGGVIIQAGAPDNVIGPNNIIANNNEYGVMVEGSDRNLVTQNAIFNHHNGPLMLVNGGNREWVSHIEPGSIEINCASGFISAEIFPSPIQTLEVFSGDESGMMVYEGSLELDAQPNDNGDDVRTSFTFEKGEAFQGGYLYFGGHTADGETTTFTDAVVCESGLGDVAQYLDNPRLVWLDTFGTPDNVEKWYMEFPTDAVGGKVVDGHLVFDSPNGDWRMAKLNDPLTAYLEEANESGSQAILMTFQYTGNSGFRVQASIRPQDNPDYLYETGIMFDNGPQQFIQSPDEAAPLEDMQGPLEIQPDTDYQYLMAIDNASGNLIAAIWEKGNPQNARTWDSPINPDMVNQPWNFVVFGYSQTQIRVDEIQILAFGN